MEFPNIAFSQHPELPIRAENKPGLLQKLSHLSPINRSHVVQGSGGGATLPGGDPEF